MAGRPSTTRSLAVWMNGERVGTWTYSPSRGHGFSYAESWLGHPLARPLSLSLPLAAGTLPFKDHRVNAYFDNLLPDSITIRKRVAQKFGAASTEAFELLQRIGRDCVGAVQLTPIDTALPDVRRIDAEPLSDEAVERLLNATVSAAPPGLSEDELRISIAGTQEKTALLRHLGQWCRPLGTTPTTHILKLPLGEVGGMRADFSTSVENEWLCSRIVHAFGLPIAECEILTFGERKVLAVERFDRKLIGGSWWARLPQEDFCQVTAVPSSHKYEEHGGPGMATILGVLAGSMNAELDRRNFLAAQLLFWMLAAPDGHAKNFSIFLEPGGRYRLTPLYDVMSAWPVIGDGARMFQWQKVKLAMAVRSKNAHYRMRDIQRRHWNAVAKANAMGEDFEDVIQDFLERTPRIIEAVSAELPATFPAAVSEPIFAGLRAQAERLSRG